MLTFLRKMTISRKLGLALLAIVVLFVVELLGFYLASLKFLQGLSNLHRTQELSVAVSQLHQLGEAMGDLATRRPIDAAASRDTVRAFDGIYEQALTTVKAARGFARSEPDPSEFLDEIESSLVQADASARSEIPVSGQAPPDRQALMTRQYVVDAVELVDQLKVLVERKSDADFEQIYRSRYWPFVLASLLTLVLVTLALSGGTLMTRRLVASISELVRATEEVARGNLAVTTPIRSQDEIGTLTHAFNAMTESLQRTTVSKLEFERLYQEAREAVESRDEFMSIASHELKTPLTAMGLQLQLLSRILQGASDQGVELLCVPPQAARMAITCESQSRRLAALLDELLDLTRIRIGRLQLNLEPVDLELLVRDVFLRFKLEAAQKGIRISFRSTAPRGPSGLLDPVRVEQVVSNLISNALKYGRGSPIEVALDWVEVLRNGQLAGTRARLSVRDQGPGVPPEMRERIFDRFVRASAEKRRVSGLGLGLYISRQIVEAHGGSIRVESEPGRGTTFTVELPVSLPQVVGQERRLA